LRVSVPELRIVPQELWDTVQATLAERAHGAMPPRRPRKGSTFLQGMITCGCCGGMMTAVGPRDLVRCANRALRNTCDNPRTPSAATIEKRVAEALNSDLLHPDVV